MAIKLYYLQYDSFTTPTSTNYFKSIPDLTDLYRLIHVWVNTALESSPTGSHNVGPESPCLRQKGSDNSGSDSQYGVGVTMTEPGSASKPSVKFVRR